MRTETRKFLTIIDRTFGQPRLLVLYQIDRLNQTVVETIEDLIWSLIEDGCSIGIRVCERKLPQPIWKFLYAVGYDLEDEGVHRCLYNFFTDEPRDIEYDVDIDKYETPVSVHNLIADITRHA